MIEADVILWGTKIGTVWQENIDDIPKFQYESSFIKSNIEVSPIMMPLSEQVYSFPLLSEESFSKLPGLLSDSLPDSFGNKLINTYLESQGRSGSELSPIEKLCYIGKRGMGALEFRPQTRKDSEKEIINIDELSKLAIEILNSKEKIEIKNNENVIEELIKIGKSAGGMRPKAIVAYNEKTEVFKSGQINAGKNFDYWIIKFDTYKEDEPISLKNYEFTKVEYAYNLMAKDCGINVAEQKLFKKGGKCHYMSKRFDRTKSSEEKIHMQTFGALMHYDFNKPGEYSYRSIAELINRLNIGQGSVEEIFRRMVFNCIALNFDDHVKNVSFLMNKKGEWCLSPDYDINFSYNPNGQWTNMHQIRINGKTKDITIDDLIIEGQYMNISNNKIMNTINKTKSVVNNWKEYAKKADTNVNTIDLINKYLIENNNLLND